MNKAMFFIMLCFFASATSGFAGERGKGSLRESRSDVVYWNSAASKTLRTRIPADADYWQLSPAFAVQSTQTYCSVASAITVLNAMPVEKPVDPAYAPYAYFTQHNYFTPEVTKVISPQAVLAMGMTREQMADTLSDAELRSLLQSALGDDGQFVLVNYLRAVLGQAGDGHWSVLAAFDAQSDSVLILDVAKYKYPPVWVGINTLRQAIATIDTASNKARGLVIASQ